MLSQQKLKLDYYKIDSPAFIELEGGVTIQIDRHNNVTITGLDNVKINSKNDLNLDAKKINMRAEELNIDIDGDVYLGSSNSIFQQTPRIDLNFYGNNKSGYRAKR
jgi:hypothetical protein